jgi:C4-dicarboxylate-specific signal transduction histidine kinase
VPYGVWAAAVLVAILGLGVTTLPAIDSLHLALAVGLGLVLIGAKALTVLPGREAASVAAAEASERALGERLVTEEYLPSEGRLLAENIRSLEETNRELVEARAEIVRTARLASVGTLAAGIAHEVGNPLGAIMAYVDVARTRAQKGELAPAILDSIREEANRIDRIVRGLLDYARPANSEVRPTSPSSVVDRVRDLLDSQGRLDHVDDSWTLGEDVPQVVMDPHRLEHVLVNLLLNALDALDQTPAGRISVRVYGDSGDAVRMPARRENDPPSVNYMHRRRISRDDGGRGLDPAFSAERVAVIEVSDNGPGIAEKDLERVFDPFFTTKEPGKGTGLGLAICARLIEGMGGRIDADNGPEGGARFMIRLPGEKAPTAERTTAEQS